MLNFIKNIFDKPAKHKNQTQWIVSKIIKETKDSATLVFEKPIGFEYLPGQFLSIEKNIGGKNHIREYSFSSSPHEQNVTLTIKQIKDGKFSTFINSELKAGDSLTVSKPKGDFTIDLGVKKFIVAFVGGSGITPVMSIIKSILNSKNGSKIQLFYGNQSEDSIIFNKTLNDLQKENPEALQVTHILEKPNQESLSGIIDIEKLDLFSKNYFDVNDVDEFLICGPGPMIENINEYLLNKGISDEKIKYELFTPSEKLNAQNKSTGVVSEVKYILDETESSIQYQDTSKSILESLLVTNENIPYSCKSGVCGTCTSKVVSGKVNFLPPKVNILTDDNIKNGYILTCCSYPNSKNVTIDFDDTPI